MMIFAAERPVFLREVSLILSFPCGSLKHCEDLLRPYIGHICVVFNESLQCRDVLS